VGVKFFNGYGSFSDDGREYIISLKSGESTPAPWCNCLANEKVGCIISENGGGWTWLQNSREFKITDWSNDPILDPPSEILEFTVNNQTFRATEGERTIIHGFGYTEFHKNYNNLNLKIKQTVFIPLNRSAKVIIVNIENKSDSEQNIIVKYKIKPTLGVHSRKTWHYIESSEENNKLILQNQFSEQFPYQKICLTSSLDSKVNTNEYSISASLSIKPNKVKEIYFELGVQDSNSNNYSVHDELNGVKDFWQKITDKTRIQTDDEANDILLGGWLVYQNISCRLWARSGFYQCGGAFGFRDQLKDLLSIFKIMPELSKKIILQACEHQYIEGDVQHWYHLPRHGVRT
jgi:cellobiose phosphorylase